MKQTCKQNRLPIVTVVLGCCALILRRVLYAVAVDVKNLLPVNHPLEIVLWVLTAIAAAWIIASVWKLDGSAKYEDNFQPSLMAAVGHYIAAAGILLTVLLPWWMEGRLLLLRRVRPVSNMRWKEACSWQALLFSGCAMAWGLSTTFLKPRNLQ